MENATKALLIAAAVLVAILIISLGLVVYNMASETVDNAGNLDEYQIQQFNEKFKKYEGTSKSGSDVNALINTVFNHNLAQEDETTRVSVTASGNGVPASWEDIDAADTPTSSPSKVSTGGRYTVECTYDTNTKLITSITITGK